MKNKTVTLEDVEKALIVKVTELDERRSALSVARARLKKTEKELQLILDYKNKLTNTNEAVIHNHLPNSTHQ